MVVRTKRGGVFGKRGAGRKPYFIKLGAEHLDEKFLAVLREHTVGDLMDGTIRWTNLSNRDIVKALWEDHALVVSRTVVRKWLNKHHYRRRKAQKKVGFKRDIEHRNEQFENITRLTADYEAAGNPMVSLDTKKKEHLGNLYRDGRLYTREQILTYDHDFPSDADGIIIPHCCYDWRACFAKLAFISNSLNLDNPVPCQDALIFQSVLNTFHVKPSQRFESF